MSIFVSIGSFTHIIRYYLTWQVLEELKSFFITPYTEKVSQGETNMLDIFWSTFLWEMFRNIEKLKTVISVHNRNVLTGRFLLASRTAPW